MNRQPTHTANRKRTATLARLRCLFAGFVVGAMLLSLTGCKRPAAKEDAAEDARESNADADTATLRLRNLALAYIDAELYDDATRALDELAVAIPGEPMVHANLGLIDLRESRMELAQQHLETAAAISPDDPSIAILLARVASEQRDDQTARRILEHAVNANPDHLHARWALADLLRRAPDEASRTERVHHFETILEQVPANVLVRLALIRELLDQADLDRARRHLSVLEEQGVASTEQARQLLANVIGRVESNEARAAWSLATALDNVLKPERAWQFSLAEVAGPRVALAEPIREFLVHNIPEPTIEPNPVEVIYHDVTATIGLDRAQGKWATMTVTDSVAPPVVLVLHDGSIETWTRQPGQPFEQVHAQVLDEWTSRSNAVISCATPIDWNNDLRIDLAFGLDDGSVHVATQAEDGAWTSITVVPAPTTGTTPVTTLRAWDADLDGDLDLLVGRIASRPILLRNHGDETWTDIAPELGLTAENDPAWIDGASADLDEDGDLDLYAIDEQRTLLRFTNERSGRFTRFDTSALGSADALALADFDNDGWIDLAYVSSDGRLGIAGHGEAAAMDVHDHGTLPSGSDDGVVLRPLDFDNDGWLDLLTVVGGRPSLHRNRGHLDFETEDILPSDAGLVRDAHVADHDADGDLDLLVIMTDGRLRLWDNDGGNRNAWQTVRLEAIVTGGQRNNSFGLGGVIELRAGRAYQKRLVSGPVAHFGLGKLGPADSIRVVWPNGVPQYVLEPDPQQLLVEKQTLKGSCPFLFAWNGQSFEFVTDLLWRSPLGMRINAQTIAPVGTTRDYVKIEERQLRPRDGRYEITITAALWETIFLDTVDLWIVDHPASVEIFVDERFVAPVFPPFQIHVVDAIETPAAAVDHRGRDVLDVIAARDGRRLGGFEKGRFQGIAETHHIDLVMPSGTRWGAGTARLLASGWIMPTDSSINVAISQGAHVPPEPLSLHVADGQGGWIETIPNAGFPAGKLKTIVLDLPAFPSPDHRVRLATNLEIYWDRLAFAREATTFEPQPVSLAVVGADLEPVGFPTMVRSDDRAPEVPDYTKRSHQPRWRDLHGRYTRFGDVRELIADVDDRYVIMNAGDAVVLSFDAPDAPPTGWVRDFVLVTDGWVKDGDWNTAASKTVGPLPHHHMTGYPDMGPATPPPLLPGHDDWTRYHTRFVTSVPFRDRMRP